MGVKQQRTSTVIIKNIPNNIRQNDLQSVYEKVGNIRQIFVTKSKTGGQNLGFVKFTTVEEASKAISSIKQIKGQNIVSTFARKKPRKNRNKIEKADEADLSESDDEQTPVSEPSAKPILNKCTKNASEDVCFEGLSRNQKTVFVFGLPPELLEKDVRKKFRKIGAIDSITTMSNVTAVTFLEDSASKLAIKKLHNHIFKQSLISVVASLSSDKSIKKLLKPSRIIIRNLSFKITEDILRDELSKHGVVVDVSIPKTDNGRIKGFAFVTLINKFVANKIMQKLNGKDILDRKVAIDWAVSKDQYQNNPKNGSAKLDDLPEDDEEDCDKNDQHSSDKEMEENNMSDEEVANIDLDKSNEMEESESETSKKQSYDDVKEGKTLLLGNLPFDTEKEEIEDRFTTYGRIRYIRLVYDHEKDRPKGTAFMQFFRKEDAENCLKAVSSNPCSLKGREISVKLVVEKSKLSFGQQREKKRDNRNLHLAMEGVIKEGTNAADGVSKTDMMKRKLAFEAKKKKLKSLNHFVSKTRLCVRNMPAGFNETELKKLMSKYGHVVQVKIMRDIKRVDSNGIGKSKGYGFVEFSKHETALTALRNTNNNPDIFTTSKRPIVDFSIENINIVQSRVKRSVAKPEQKSTKKSFNQRWKEAREKKKDKQVVKTATGSADLKSNVILAAEGNKNHNEDTQSKKKSKKSSKKSNAFKKVKTSQSTVDSVPEAKKSVKTKSMKIQKPKKEHSNAEESKLRDLIDSYKSKLNNVHSREKLKRWYED